MPCYEPDFDSKNLEGCRKKLNAFIDMLCEQCESLEKNGNDKLMTARVMDWRIKHVRWDCERKIMESQGWKLKESYCGDRVEWVKNDGKHYQYLPIQSDITVA